MDKVMDYAWPALEMLGVSLLWGVKIGYALAVTVVQLMLLLSWVLLVLLVFQRLPRPMMRYL